MSWNLSGTATARRASGGDAIGAHFEFPNPSPQSGHGEEESRKAMQVAQDAARALLESGAFGTGSFDVLLSGHANPGNKPASHWVNDSVQITIRQKGEAA